MVPSFRYFLPPAPPPYLTDRHCKPSLVEDLLLPARLPIEEGTERLPVAGLSRTGVASF